MKIPAKPELRGSTVSRYAIAILTAVGAVLATRALRTISPRVPADLIYCATILSAWFGGIGPGFVAAAISSAAIASNFIPPPAPGIAPTSEVPRIIVIALGVFVVSSSRSIIEARGGQLSLVTTDGPGATFEMRLPALTGPLT